jgi:putative peptidoglycan lipid II flippase
VTVPVAERGAARQRLLGIGHAAVLIGVITVFARVVGFGRQVVFAHTVGSTCVGTAYTTANMVPNIVYDVVLGGALSAVVVPVLAGSSGRSGTEARQISSALLTWTVLLLTPVSVIVALAARPIVSVLLGGTHGCLRPGLISVSSRMLIVFAPQILLYGLAVVLYGILQAHRRFGAPALAPLVSSVVVIAVYGAFGAVGGQYVNRLASLPAGAEFLLSGGTTLGVLALVLTAAVPLARLRAGQRLPPPTLRFPPRVGGRVRRLALAGVFTLIAQDASAVVVIVLANRHGGVGALVLYGFAWAVFVVPYAVLAVPIATSAFPELSERSEDFDATSAGSTRAVLLVSWLGAAALAGARVPVARVFESHSVSSASTLAVALALFAPGLVGYGLAANLSRVLYALGHSRSPALAVSGGWLLVIAADVAIVPLVPRARVVAALGLGTTIGLTVAGVALLVLVLRARGTAALAGGLRASVAGFAGCVAGVVAGSAVSLALHVSGFFPNVGVSVLVCAVVAVAFLLVVMGVDGGDLRAAARRLRARAALRVRAS